MKITFDGPGGSLAMQESALGFSLSRITNGDGRIVATITEEGFKVGSFVFRNATIADEGRTQARASKRGRKKGVKRGGRRKKQTGEQLPEAAVQGSTAAPIPDQTPVVEG